MAAITSNGNGGGPWATGSSWAGGSAPGSSDTATIANGDTVTVNAPAAIGTSPADTTTNVLTVYGTLVVDAPLVCKGNLFAGGTLRINGGGGSGIEFDSSGDGLGAGSHSEYVLGVTYASRLYLGSSGSRCFVRSNAAGGNARIGGTQMFAAEFLFCDFTRIGTAVSDAITLSFNTDQGSNPVLVDHCNFDTCSGLHLYNVPADSRFEFTNNTFTNSLPWPSGRAVSSNASLSQVGLGTGTRLLTGNRFDLSMAVFPPDGFTINGNVFNLPPTSSGTTAWASFDDNFVRITGETNLSVFYGDVTNCFLYFDEPTFDNPHFAGFVGTTAASLRIAGNVAYFNGTAVNGNVFLPPEPLNAATPVVTEFNILLPNAGGATSGVLGGIGSSGTHALMYVRHNTACVEGQFAIELGEQAEVENPNRWQSHHANLYYGSTGDNGPNNNPTLKVANTRPTGEPPGSGVLTDIIPPGVQDYNAGYKLNSSSNVAAFANRGNGYDSSWSATPGTHDVSLDGSGGPKFKDPTATYLKWGQSLDGTITTEGQVTAKVLAGVAGFTVAAFLAYIRDAQRPTNAALKAYAGNGTEAFPSDPATTDAAGNALTGTIGAMAYLSVVDSTPPTLSSGAIPSAGATLTATLSESGCVPSSGAGGFTMSGTSATVSSWAISGTTLTLTLSGTAYAGETITLSYSRSATTDDVADAAGNYLADFSGAGVTNSSLQAAPTDPVLPAQATLAAIGSGFGPAIGPGFNL